ncbi:TraR/DksA C4-type zinc finger protein [Candidatus Gottesmanbacteria bacterium]|nr:TraR/DksA C4-type zinc finger protein [Candidatus Gottesmanbacteria bacterium]
MFKFPKNVLSNIKNYLEEKQKQTEKRLSELKKEDPFSDPTRLSDNAASDTEAKEEFGHDTISAIQLELSRGLVRIRKTLTKIKIGKYGICENCGKMIDTERLTVMPTAELCVDCEKRNEKK